MKEWLYCKVCLKFVYKSLNFSGYCCVVQGLWTNFYLRRPFFVHCQSHLLVFQLFKWKNDFIAKSASNLFIKVWIFQVIAALYKAFGQTFIYDDHFLSIVGAICSFFNCSGRLIYGFIMDKTSYKVAMSLEAVLLTLLGEYILLFQIPFFP